MSLNTIAVVGRLGGDPEFKTTPTGVSVANFRVAVNRTKKDEADWFRVECWRQTAEWARDYLTKGREVSIVGRMECRQYEKDGEKREAWQIVAQDVQFVGPKPQPATFGGTSATPEEIPF